MINNNDMRGFLTHLSNAHIYKFVLFILVWAELICVEY